MFLQVKPLMEHGIPCSKSGIRSGVRRVSREGWCVVSGGVEVGVSGSGRTNGAVEPGAEPAEGAGSVRREAAGAPAGSAAVRRRPWTFIALVFALSVPFVGLGFVAGSIPGLPNGLPMSALMFVCPAVAAMILVRREDGPGGVKALWRRTFRLDTPGRSRWIAVAFGLPVVVMALAYAGLRLTGVALPLGDAPWAGVPVFFVLYFVSAAGEEAGWTAYATDALRVRAGWFGAGLVLGIVWAVWHVVPLMQAGRSLAWIGGWFLGTVALRVAMVRVYAVSGGSVLTAILAHDMVNVGSSLFPSYEKASTATAIGLGCAVAAGVLWFVTGRTDSAASRARPIRP